MLLFLFKTTDVFQNDLFQLGFDILVLLALLFLGGESIFGFALALTFGVLVGTYSSVFIATPIMFDSLKKTIAEEKATAA